MCVKLCMIPEEFVSTRFLKYFSLLVLWTFSRDNTPRHLMRLNSSRISRYGPYIHSTWQQQQPANTLSFLSIDTQISGIDNLRALARLNQRIVFQITTSPKSKMCFVRTSVCSLACLCMTSIASLINVTWKESASFHVRSHTAISEA